MNWPVSYTKGCMYSNEVHAGLYWYIIWCTSCFSFSLVGWLLLLLVVAVSFLLLLFQFSLETKVIEPWARSGSNWSNAQLPQLHWATVEIWVVFVLLIGAGVCLDIFCVSSRQLDFTNFSSNNMEFIMRSFRSKKLQQQHEGTMKNPLHLLAFSDTVWPRPCLERPLLRRLDGMAKFGLISSRLERRWSISEPTCGCINFIFSNPSPLLRYGHHIALPNFNHVLERHLPSNLFEKFQWTSTLKQR